MADGDVTAVVVVDVADGAAGADVAITAAACPVGTMWACACAGGRGVDEARDSL